MKSRRFKFQQLLGHPLWVSEVERNTLSRLTTDPAFDYVGVWTSDGRRVVFNSDREGGRGLFSKAADGTGEVEHLATIEEARNLVLWGRPVGSERLVFDYLGTSGRNVSLLSLDEQPSLQPLLASEANEQNATISADGRWMAYQSDETGDWEVYVQRFPDGGQRRRISTAGGLKPLWSPDGDALFYVKGNALMAVAVKTEPILTLDTPMVLFEADQSLEDTNRGLQDISPDGQRFLALLIPGSSSDNSASPQINVVLNWHQELLERVPVP